MYGKGNVSLTHKQHSIREGNGEAVVPLIMSKAQKRRGAEVNTPILNKRGERQSRGAPDNEQRLEKEGS